MKNIVNNTSLKEKVALVTGSSRGIGRSIAIELAKNDATVILNYLNKTSEAQKTLSEIIIYSPKHKIIQANVAVAEEVNKMVRTIESDFETVDILVNNAAIAKPKDIDNITEEDWDETISINLKSVFLVTQAVLPNMRKKGWGRIINISSTAAYLGGIIGPHYTASKAGIIGLTHSYASLLVNDGITVNTIAPALIKTDMIAGNNKVNPESIPVKRLGTPEEIAQVTLMLIQNSYMTGQTINVNGGLYFT